MVTRFLSTKDRNAASCVRQSCTLDSQSVDNWNTLIPLAEMADQPQLQYYAHYRAGNYSKALEGLRNRNDLKALNHFFLAMIHYRLGDTKAAQRQFALGEQWIAAADEAKKTGFASPAFPQMEWGAWMEIPQTLAIQREARELIFGAAE
jgi:hypothetical protein